MSKKSLLRFGVRSDNGLVSSTWKILTKNNEIYLLERQTGNSFKVSLHKSGNWQISFTSEFIADKEIPNQNRHIDKWKAPTDNIAPGMTLAFRIIIPESELREPVSTSKKKIEWIKAPKEKHYVEIDVILTKPYVKTSSWPGKNNMQTSLLKEIKLSNGDTLWLVYRYHPMNSEDIQKLEQYKKTSQTKLKEIHSKNLKGILGDAEKDGSRKFIEVSLS